MTSTTALRISAILGLLAVGLGAFGAHGLEKMLTSQPQPNAYLDHFTTLPPSIAEVAKKLEWWKTAVTYHLIHAVVMLALSLATPLRPWAWRLFLGGIVIFSGTLYAMALGMPKWLGAITPIGGLSLMAGWLALACGKVSSDPRPE